MPEASAGSRGLSQAVGAQVRLGRPSAAGHEPLCWVARPFRGFTQLMQLTD